MKRAILESPFAGRGPDEDRALADESANLAYALDLARAITLSMGDSVIASHLLWPRFIEDRIPAQRQLGIAAGLAWAELADVVYVGIDRGLSRGMALAIQAHKNRHKPLVPVTLSGWAKSRHEELSNGWHMPNWEWLLGCPVLILD